MNWSNNLTYKLKSLYSVYRGSNLSEIDETIMQNKSNYLNNNVAYVGKKDIHEFMKVESSVSFLANYNFVDQEMRNTIDKATEMFSYNAYIHQYTKYGMEKDDFRDAIAFCEQINFDYMNN